MPVNFVQVKQNLPSYSQNVKALKAEEDRLGAELWADLQAASDNVAAIREKIMASASRIKNLWCACPTDEPLLTHRPCPALPSHYTIMAADGSQILPSRHKAIPFCVVNVGVIIARMGSGDPPDCLMHSLLVDYPKLFSADGGLVNDDMVSLWRDHAERLALMDHIDGLSAPIITLTDGLLGLYMGSRSDMDAEPYASEIYQAYKDLESLGVIAAGYIDKPGSDLIGRMFSLLRMPDDEITRFDAKTRYYKGIPDAVLLSRVLSNPGERSAIFKVISTQDRKSENDLEVHFFFINIGTAENPYLVRVEIPGWIVRFEDRIDFLHAAIVHEARVLDTHPYPYILHRAHELAVIHMDEHDEVERLLIEAYSEQGIPLGVQSNKEANKIITGRERPDE